MAEMDLAAVMDELATRVGAIPGFETVYPWPMSTVSPPCFVVGYPPEIELDTGMRRGSDRAQFPCWAVFGYGDPASARDVMSGFLLGLKAALDGDGTSWSSARAMSIAIAVVTQEDGTETLDARFTVDVIS